MVESTSDSTMKEKRSKVKWDATEGSNGGAERTAWCLLEMEKYNNNVEEMDRGAVTMVVGVATSF